MEITQKTGMFGGKVSVHITNNDELIFTHEKMLNKSTSKYLLDHIDPLFESYKQFSMAAAITSAVFLVLAIFLYWYGKTQFSPPEDVGYLFISGIFFIAALIAGAKAIKSRLNVVCFNSHDGRRLFSLFGNKPSATEVEKFCDGLKKRIERIKYNGEISNDRMLEILGKHVDFLFEHDVLNQSEREAALKKISSKSKLNVVKLSSKDNV